MNFKVMAQGGVNLIIRRYMGPFWYRRRWLEKTQWWSQQELESLQLILLKRLISHAYKTVPYYRILMDKLKIRVENIKTLDDIKMFPVFTKESALKAGNSIVSNKYPSWLLRKTHTSGTTGTPLMLRRDIFSIENEHAFVRRQWDWAGLGINDRCAYLKGRVLGEKDTKSGRLYAYDPIMKELHLSTFHLTYKTAKEYADIISSYGIKGLVGYPSAVNILARGCLDSGIKLKFQSVLVTSEILTQSTRDIISRAFDCKVYDFYGSAERVSYIHTCDYGSYHIVPEYGLLELIPIENNKDGECRLIATGFWNMAMPLIRYDTEDLVYPSNETCQCGRAFPVIKSIIGREGDVIITPSGKELGVCIISYIVYVLCGVNNIIESQIIQDNQDHIIINYVPDQKFTSEDLSEFKNRLAKYLPNDLKFTLQKVDSVQKTNAGKIKPVISLISGMGK